MILLPVKGFLQSSFAGSFAIFTAVTVGIGVYIEIMQNGF
jgi:hypothetical protein